MRLSQFRKDLHQVDAIQLVQSNGIPVPPHFHITEAGLTTKHFIDCGGTIRTEKTISFQVWVAEDAEHRLTPGKLEKIISIAEPLFDEEDLDVEIEYQDESISRYGLTFNGAVFQLTPKQTDCLAKENCGVPAKETKAGLTGLVVASSCCSPGGNCC